MPLPELVLDGVDIVLRGRFNPSIFSPAWLLSQGIIGPAEYAAADVDFITRDVAVFKVGWLGCQTTPDALQLSTTEVDEFERARDAAQSVLRALPHTPVSALGINRAVHFAADSLEQWHAVGDRVVPKDIWNDSLVAPGTRSVTLWGARPDQYTGRVQVQVEPSFRVPRAVYVSINDHYQLTYSEHGPDARSRDVAWQVTMEDDVEPGPEKLEVAHEVLSGSWAASLVAAKQSSRACSNK